jgi:hypothetical protein
VTSARAPVEVPVTIQSVALVEDIGIVGDGLILFDAASPNLNRLGSLRILNARIEQAVLLNGIAIVASGGAGLTVVDISTPAAAVVIANLASPGYAESVFLDGDLLYLADGGTGLRVIDISDPGPSSRNRVLLHLGLRL